MKLHSWKIRILILYTIVMKNNETCVWTGVELAETSITITTIDGIIEKRNASYPYTANIKLEGKAAMNSANIIGTALWNITLYASPDGSTWETFLGITNLTDLQSSTELQRDMVFQFDGEIEAKFFTTGLTCDQIRYICLRIEEANSPAPDFTFSMNNTYACAEINCTGKVRWNRHLNIIGTYF